MNMSMSTLLTMDGIVLRRRAFAESKCFLDLLTNKCGIIEVVVHSYRKLNGKNTSGSDLFTYGRYCVSKKKARYTMNSCEIKYTFFSLANDLQRFALASYFSDVLSYTVTREQRHNDIVRFFAITLFELSAGRIDPDTIKAIFELKLSAMSGFMPGIVMCASCGKYEHERMYFNMETGLMLCGDCMGGDLYYTFFSPAVLYAVRYAVFSDIDKVYKGNLFKGGKNNNDFRCFCDFAEKYLLSRLEHSFSTLEYYKNTAGTQNIPR